MDRLEGGEGGGKAGVGDGGGAYQVGRRDPCILSWLV